MGKPSRKRRNPMHQSEGNGRSNPRALTPHSSAWFEAQLQTETLRALWTGEILGQAGRMDACSVCGDTPAPIYDDLEEPYLPLRLCADCIGWQQALGARLRLRPRQS